MVNHIISKYRSGPFPWVTDIRKISSGPLYRKADIDRLLTQSGARAIKPVTRKCIDHIEQLDIGPDELFELVRSAVTAGRYINSEWCVLDAKGSSWAACDAYVYTRAEWYPHLFKTLNCEYFIKLAIGKSGKMLFLISCHLPKF